MLVILWFVTTMSFSQVPRIAAVDGPLGEGIPAVVERRAGVDAEVRLVLLDGRAVAPVIIADVLINGGVLAAPRLKGLRLTPAAKPSHPALIEGSISIPAPKTDAPLTETVYVSSVGGDGALIRIGSFLLRWVPWDDCRTALAHEATKAGRGLLLFGALPGLREQLHAWKLPFDDFGIESPLHIGAQTCAIGEASSTDIQAPSVDGTSTLFLVSVASDKVPEIRQRKAPGAQTEVQLGRSADWRQSAFLIRQLIQHLTSSAP